MGRLESEHPPDGGAHVPDDPVRGNDEHHLAGVGLERPLPGLGAPAPAPLGGVADGSLEGAERQPLLGEEIRGAGLQGPRIDLATLDLRQEDDGHAGRLHGGLLQEIDAAPRAQPVVDQANVHLPRSQDGQPIVVRDGDAHGGGPPLHVPEQLLDPIGVFPVVDDDQDGSVTEWHLLHPHARRGKFRDLLHGPSAPVPGPVQ